MKKLSAVLFSLAVISVLMFCSEQSMFKVKEEIASSCSETLYEAGDLEEIIAEISVENNETVYIAPTGKKYHRKKTCAGGNAIRTTIDSVEHYYEPCKKCA